MPPSPAFTRPQLQKAVTDSFSFAAVLRRLKLAHSSSSYKTVRKYCKKWGIDTSHFNPNIGKSRGGIKPLDLEEVLVRNSSYSRSNLKRRLYQSGLKERQCEICGQGEVWQGKNISLILDHINGVNNDNRLENLRIVCPNCNAALETHCGRRKRKRCLECNSLVERWPNVYCSKRCLSKHKSRKMKGVPRPKSRKVSRPSWRQLQRDLATMTYADIGRKYGVSDNSIRKWEKMYKYQSR